MKRYYWGIDLFKFIFSLLVICIHTNPLLDMNSKANLIVSGLLASFAVPYFFVVSGYMSGDKPLKHIIKKPLYLCIFWIGIYLVLVQFWKMNFINVLGLILISGGYYHLWYLVVLIYCMIICKILFEKLPDRLCVIICGFTYIVGCVFRTYLEIDTTAGVFLFRLLSIGLPFYYYGMRIKKNNEEKNHLSLKWKNYLFIILWIVEVFIVMKKGTTVGYTLLFTTFPVVNIIFVWSINLSQRKELKIAPLLGKLSMIIYCVHPAIIWGIQGVARKMGVEKLHSLLLFFWVSIISGLLGLFWRIVTSRKVLCSKSKERKKRISYDK